MAIDNKKEQEREELHRAIWAIADELRGAVDGWDFKNYVLGTMFYRYVSENLTAYINDGEVAAGNTDFDYAKMSDADVEEAREGLVEEKGFFILPSELFCNVRAKAANDENLNETLERVFNHIEESAKGSQSEGSFAGLFDDFDVNSNKLGSTVAKRNERLAKLLDGVAEMNLGSVKDHDIDAFGDAYEYLMTMYASNAGKSGGEFFTPADVSELLTRLGTVGKKTVNKVYDPACGSGSLLLKAEKVLGKEAVMNGFFGQEINITTYNLCRINMFLHDIGFEKFDIECEDTLVNPQHWDDEPFELIVSNPPYSIKWEGDDNPLLINDPRFSPAGVLAPKSNADFAFILHSLSWLASNGAAAIVCYPGILYRRGAEKKIRKYLVDNNYIDCLIQLPENLFYGTPTAVCIMVLKKNKKDNNVLFINARNDYVKVTNNNRLSKEIIDKIIKTYEDKISVDGYSNSVHESEIAQNDYDLSVSSYVGSDEAIEEILSIEEIDEKLNSIKIEIQTIQDKLAVLMEEENNIENSKKESIPITDLASTYIGLVTTMTKHYVENGVPLIRNSDIKENRFEFKKPIYLDEQFAEKNTNRRHQMGDIITVHTGDVGTSAIIEEDLVGSLGFATIVTRILDTSRISQKYLCHYLNSNVCKRQISGMIKGDRNNLNLKDYNKLIIPVPPIDIQNRVVSLLDEMDKLNLRLLELLKEEIEVRTVRYNYTRDSVFLSEVGE